jgi:predicted nucleotidyltransferase
MSAAPALAPRVVALVRDVLARHPGVREAVLFGSRAKGTAKPSSDVDLALLRDVPPLELARIAGELDELPLPLRFDVQALDRIAHEGLREHIARVGVRVYARSA